MKYLLIPLALVAGSAFACPGSSSKDAMAEPASAKPVVAQTATDKPVVVDSKAVTKVVAKPAPQTRKLTGL